MRSNKDVKRVKVMNSKKRRSVTAITKAAPPSKRRKAVTSNTNQNHTAKKKKNSKSKSKIKVQKTKLKKSKPSKEKLRKTKPSNLKLSKSKPSKVSKTKLTHRAQAEVIEALHVKALAAEERSRAFLAELAAREERKKVARPTNSYTYEYNLRPTIKKPRCDLHDACQHDAYTPAKRQPSTCTKPKQNKLVKTKSSLDKKLVKTTSSLDKKLVKTKSCLNKSLKQKQPKDGAKKQQRHSDNLSRTPSKRCSSRNNDVNAKPKRHKSKHRKVRHEKSGSAKLKDDSDKTSAKLERKATVGFVEHVVVVDIEPRARYDMRINRRQTKQLQMSHGRYTAAAATSQRRQKQAYAYV